MDEEPTDFMRQLEASARAAVDLEKNASALVATLRKLQSSHAWRIARGMMRLAMNPATWGRGPTTLDELEHHLERHESLVRELGQDAQHLQYRINQARARRRALMDSNPHASMRVAIKAGVESPGELHLNAPAEAGFATALAAAMSDLGLVVRVDARPDWYREHPLADDAVLAFDTANGYQPQPHHLNLLLTANGAQGDATAPPGAFDAVIPDAPASSGDAGALAATVHRLLEDRLPGLAGSEDPPDYVREVLEESRRVAFDGADWPGGVRGDDPVLISVVRDERPRLPGLLSHYRALGVQRFVFLDNGSSDGSADWLAAQDGVRVLPVDRPFSWVAKQGWIHRVIEEIGRSGWFLVVDADEHVVFDNCEALGFAGLIRRMERAGIRRVRGMLVDMYAPGPVLEQAGGTGEAALAAHRLFDADGYTEAIRFRMISRTGGPRRRCFSGPEGRLEPELGKYPLFRLGADEVMANPHHIYPYADNFTSPCYLGILHYKFLPGLPERIEFAVRSGAYWEGSAEYRAYRAALERDPGLALAYPGSREFTGPGDLVEAGLINALPC